MEDKITAEWVYFCSGSGDGSGSGSGIGDGIGDGFGSGIASYNDMTVYLIDGIQTIVRHIHGNYAKGYILNGDLTLSPCYVAKQDNVFAHGGTLHEAFDALSEKLFADMPEESRISAFIAAHPDENVKYACRDLWEWHHRLTGSCETGRNSFAKNHGIDIDNSAFTVPEFYELCKNDYGGNIIAKMWEDWKNMKDKYGRKYLTEDDLK